MSELIFIKSTDFPSEMLEQQLKEHTKVFVLMDSNTLQHVWPKFAHLTGLKKAEILEIEPGEESKCIEVCHHLWLTLLENGADRNSLLLNIGGGVVTDLGGFVASTFKRGISFINIPSSLLAMVDASVGGKTGINLGHSKNQIGVFQEAETVYIFPQLLQTLPADHLLSGFAEMIKHGLITNRDYWEKLSQIDHLTVAEVATHIKKSIKIKSEVVEADPTEKGLRKTLNFGHTFGHAIESVMWKEGHPILHGNAVALGMVLSAEVAYLRNKITEKDKNEIHKNIASFFALQPLLDIEFESLYQEMKNDKKNKNGQINFTLLNQIGNAEYDCYCTHNELKNAYNNVVDHILDNELLA